MCPSGEGSEDNCRDYLSLKNNTLNGRTACRFGQITTVNRLKEDSVKSLLTLDDEEKTPVPSGLMATTSFGKSKNVKELMSSLPEVLNATLSTVKRNTSYHGTTPRDPMNTMQPDLVGSVSVTSALEDNAFGSTQTAPFTMQPNPAEMTFKRGASTQQLSTKENLQSPSTELLTPDNLELNEWPKKNSSQSPMKTSDGNPRAKHPDAPLGTPSSWLPVLEKHDIPIVVGVGISLLLIFLTMGFYSLIQKNGNTDSSHGFLRHSGVSSRNCSKLESTRTYENRAFEDDNSVAVIEEISYQTVSSPSQPTSNTITVTAELSPKGQRQTMDLLTENILESSQNALAETGLDQITEIQVADNDFKLDVTNEWGKNIATLEDCAPLRTEADQNDDTSRQCPETEVSALGSPVPPPEEALHTSLTLQTPESGATNATPIRHNINICRGQAAAPIVLSHTMSLGDRNSLGITTVAVDVHFYSGLPGPAAVPAQGLGSNSSPAVCPELDSQDSAVHCGACSAAGVSTT
ncbi:uncharacterized protein LOC127529137 [Erpetoichthys calabaricus]|uniref:uncharacterized protein LOC127529137 n=1 Tax=Erpetoichthys calabaricus TaxID=27687 RepID=UPI002234141F|nr:uncharacterized protein LOC127529137 [Erpetoichthys calabaricus]